jgi:hypothetical protein
MGLHTLRAESLLPILCDGHLIAVLPAFAGLELRDEHTRLSNNFRERFLQGAKLRKFAKEDALKNPCRYTPARIRFQLHGES